MKRLLSPFFRRDAHPTVQFLKYAIAGGFATVVDIAVFYLLALVVFPALQPDDRLLMLLDWLYQRLVDIGFAGGEEGWLYGLLHFDVQPIPEALRRRNYLIDRCLVFFVSNFVAYVLNRWWVFSPGRHRGRVEILLFYAVAVGSFAVGTALAYLLIAAFGVSTTDAVVANIVAAVLINFVCRKYWVFRG